MLVTADLQTYSAYYFDADYEPAQILAAAVENGLRQICITDHVDFYTPSDVHLPDFAARRARLAQLRGQFPQLPGLEGAEGSMTADPTCARSAMAALDGVKLDFVIGSVHTIGAENVWPDAVYASRTARQCGVYLIDIEDETSAADQPELQRLADQYITDWTQLDWTKL